MGLRGCAALKAIHRAKPRGACGQMLGEHVAHAYPILLERQGCDPYNSLHTLPNHGFKFLLGSILQNHVCTNLFG